MKHLPDAWLDRVASDHLKLDTDLRRAIAAARRREGRTSLLQPPVETERARRSGSPRVTMTVNEARTLLRGSMPVLPQRRRARERHARLFAALGVFVSRLPTLALDPVDEHVLAAARQLAGALDAWIAELAWRRAAARARVHWPVPVAIGAVMQRSTPLSEPALFPAAAESVHGASAPAGPCRAAPPQPQAGPARPAAGAAA